MKARKFHRRLRDNGQRVGEDPFFRNDDDLAKLRRNGSAGRRTNRVLLVDDDTDQLSIFGVMLTKGGYEVVTASSAKEGLHLLKDNLVDIILCDVRMPQIDGEQFVRHLRKFPKFANIPVIMMTAAGRDLEMECLATGADMFCDKSQAPRTLLNQIRMLL